MRKRLLSSAAALFFLTPWSGPGSVDAQVLTINNGSSLTVNGRVLDVNCLDILVMNGGSLLLEGGTIQDREVLTVEPGGIFVNNAGTVLNCSAGNSFYVIPTLTGKAVIITLPKN
jgi:hypothetical protein